MEKAVDPLNEKNINLTKSCKVEESYVDPYDANSPDAIFPVTITRTPLDKITCTSPINGYTRLVNILYVIYGIFCNNALRIEYIGTMVASQFGLFFFNVNVYLST